MGQRFMRRFVIYDTEYTAWKGSRERNWAEPWEFREILQIAAVKVEVDHGCETIASFNEFIKPSINPVLSDYIIELTGITQDLVDQNGIDLASAISLFNLFCEDGGCHTLSWGDDLRVLRDDADAKQIEFPAGLIRHTDLGPVFHAVDGYDFHVYSGDLHKVLGIPVPGHAHNALHDVHSIAASLDFLVREKLILPDRLLPSVSAALPI